MAQTAGTTSIIGWGYNEFGQTIAPAGLTDARAIAAGFRYSLAARANGTVVGWGTSSLEPPAVPFGLGGVVALASSGGHNLALRGNGTVAAWSSTDPDFAGMLPRGLSNIIAVAESGFLHSLALRSDGTVVAWGRGNTNLPAGLSNVISIGAADNISVAARSDGTVVEWDGNGNALPTKVPAGLSNVVAVVATHLDFAMALRSDGTVVMWGTSAGGYGHLPDGLTNVVAVDAQSLHALAIRADGSVVAWGSNNFGESRPPARASNVVAVAAGFSHSLALTRPAPAPWPWITAQPQSRRALVGDTVTFNVTATGLAPFTYRWQYRGQDIPGQTNRALVLDDLEQTMAGDYAVVISADGLSVRSAPAFLAVSNRPVALPLTAETLEDTEVKLTLDGFDPSGLPLRWKIVTLPSAGQLFQVDQDHRGVAIDSVPALLGPERSVIYVPAPDVNGAGADSFLFVVENELGASVPAAVILNIGPVNDPPRFTRGPDVAVDEDAGPQTRPGWATDIAAGPPNEAAQTLFFQLSNDNPALFSVQPALDAAGTLTFTTAPDATGLATVIVRLQDNGGTDSGGVDTSAEQTFVIVVRPVNDAPVPTPQFLTVNEDTPLAIRLQARDPEGDPVVYSVTPPAHGVLSGAPPNLIYTPAANYNGPDRFTFSASDGQLASAAVVVEIQVLPVNDPPVPVVLVFSSALLRRPAPAQFILVSAQDAGARVILDASLSSDVEGDALQYVWVEAESTVPFAAGIRVTNTFALGTHRVRLGVSDASATSTTEVSLVVMSPGEAVEDVIAALANAALPRQRARPLITSLKAAIASFDRGQLTTGLNQLGAFQHKVQAQVTPIAPELGETLMSAVQRLVDAVNSER